MSGYENSVDKSTVDEEDVTKIPTIGWSVGWSKFLTLCQNYLTNSHESRLIYREKEV